MLENIYICRHGYRANWLDPTIVTSATGMYHDLPLAERGLIQAEHLGKYLSNPPGDLPKPELLFCSPFYRLRAWGPGMVLLRNPCTGLHARPSDASELRQYFLDMRLDETYTSTFYPSRRGESMTELKDRCDTFVEAFVKRVEAEHPDVKTVLILAHAATVIALGRALVGDDEHDVQTPTASVSLYRRKRSVAQGASALGAWDHVINGQTSHLPAGAEVNWSFSEVIFQPNGEVVTDSGDQLPFTPDDLLPEGLADGMSQYLTATA
ncbi:hypothetical protein Q5752_007075 [Cryptotrichosporon argae]